MINYVESLRKGKGDTQQQLADILEVSRQTIISIEKGHYQPSLALAIKIAQYFNKSVEEIFILEEE